MRSTSPPQAPESPTRWCGAWRIRDRFSILDPGYSIETENAYPHPAPSIQHQASRIEHRVPSIEYRASSFWFNIPGVTADPTQVAQNFFNSGYDVVLSGIDTTEALVVARQKRKEGKEVWAIPYDYKGACSGAPEVCLGVPYFNWGPVYAQFIKEAIAGKWKSQWLWLDPDWKDINNPDLSHVGFMAGGALSKTAQTAMEGFIKDLGSGKAQLFKGPLNYQDGTPFLKEGEVATDKQIWYMSQLLQGMTGESKAKK